MLQQHVAKLLNVADTLDAAPLHYIVSAHYIHTHIDTHAHTHNT